MSSSRTIHPRLFMFNQIRARMKKEKNNLKVNKQRETHQLRLHISCTAFSKMSPLISESKSIKAGVKVIGGRIGKKRDHFNQHAQAHTLHRLCADKVIDLSWDVSKSTAQVSRERGCQMSTCDSIISQRTDGACTFKSAHTGSRIPPKAHTQRSEC